MCRARTMMNGRISHSDSTACVGERARVNNAAVALVARGEIVRLVERLVARLMIASTLSFPDAAQRLGISRVTAWKWVQRGQLPAVRIGHRYRVPQRIVEAMLHPVDVGADPGGQWRCPSRRCRAVFGSAAALAAHLVTAHLGETSNKINLSKQKNSRRGGEL